MDLKRKPVTPMVTGTHPEREAYARELKMISGKRFSVTGRMKVINLESLITTNDV